MSQQPPGGFGAYPGMNAWGAPPAPAPAPSTALKTFGILAMSFAGLNAVGNFFSIVQVLLQRRMFSSELGQAKTPGLDDVQTILAATYKLTLGQGAAMVLMDVALFVVGVLLYRRSELGRKLALAWAGVAFLVLVGRAVAFELVLMPVMDHFMSKVSTQAQGGVGPFDGFFSIAARAGTYLSLGFMAIFPASLLVAMNLASVKSSVLRPGESSF